MITPAEQHDVYERLSGAFESYRPALPLGFPHVLKFPESPASLHPLWLQHAYPDGTELYSPGRDYNVTAFANSIPARKNHASLRSRARISGAKNCAPMITVHNHVANPCPRSCHLARGGRVGMPRTRANPVCMHWRTILVVAEAARGSLDVKAAAPTKTAANTH